MYTLPYLLHQRVNLTSHSSQNDLENHNKTCRTLTTAQVTLYMYMCLLEVTFKDDLCCLAFVVVVVVDDVFGLFVCLFVCFLFVFSGGGGGIKFSICIKIKA